jgi:NhaP-type Na+/H+ and K+/H+ antiporter
VEAARLEEAGAIAVVEELEASLEVLALLLTQLEMPGNVVQTLIGDYRRREVVPPRFKVAPQVRLDALAPELLSAPVATHQIQAGDWAADRSLRELNLHSVTGTSVLALQRDGRYITSPAADLHLASGDTLYLIGAEAEVESARHLLTTG